MVLRVPGYGTGTYRAIVDYAMTKGFKVSGWWYRMGTTEDFRRMAGDALAFLAAKRERRNAKAFMQTPEEIEQFNSVRVYTRAIEFARTLDSDNISVHTSKDGHGFVVEWE